MPSIEDGVIETLKREGITDPKTAPELLAIYLARALDDPKDDKERVGLARELRQTLEDIRTQPRENNDAVGALIDRQ